MHEDRFKTHKITLFLLLTAIVEIVVFMDGTRFRIALKEQV